MFPLQEERTKKSRTIEKQNISPSSVTYDQFSRYSQRPQDVNNTVINFWNPEKNSSSVYYKLKQIACQQVGTE